MEASEGPGPVGVAVPAAGSGTRMGGREKAFVELAGASLLAWSLRPFLGMSEVVGIAVALPPDGDPATAVSVAALDPRIRTVPGGATRQASVARAIEALPDEVRVVVVHDAARPLVTREIIERCLAAVQPGIGAVAGWPAVDTLKEVDAEGFAVDTPDRRRFWRAQTPQAFPRGELLEAYRRADEERRDATDDSALFTAAGGRVRMVRGAPWNLKVTFPDDLLVAARLLEERQGRGG